MFAASLGGPIVKDRLWWLMTARHQSSDEIVADVPVQIVAPDGEVINSYIDTYVRGPSLRLTWQAAQKHKIAGFVQRWWKRKGKTFSYGGDPRSGQFRDPHHAHHTVGNLKWTAPLTAHWLVEGGYSWTSFDWLGGPATGRLKERGTPEWYQYAEKTDTALNVNFDCAYDFGCTQWMSRLSQRQDNTRHVFDGRISYVTGTHNVRFGYTHEIGPDGRMANEYNGDIRLNYQNNKPSSVTVYNTPLDAPAIVEYDAALFVQDSWTLKRLTVNPGLRIEWFSAGMRETGAPAGRFAPARFFPAQQGLIRWGPDYAPRFSAVYDLFGDGRTALKFSASKYHRQYDADPAARYADAGLRSENRNWFDVDLVPGTVGTRSGIAKPTDNDGIAQDNEIGTGTDTFGERADRNPVGLNRQYNTEFTAGVQHQVLPRLAIGAMLYKRTIYEIELMDRSLISLDDYTPFTIPMPDFSNDPTLTGVLDPDEVLTVYNLKKEKNGVYNKALIDRSSSTNRSYYTGTEVSFSMRPFGRAMLFGSWTAEHNLSYFCDSNDNPNGPTTGDLYQGRPVAQGGRFCDQRQFSIPFKHEFKVAGNLPLPAGVDFAAVVQSFPGLERVITYGVPSSLFPGGRTQSQTIVLNEPGSLYQERWNQVDVNFKKNFRSGRKLFTFQVDVFNLFNNNTIFSTTDSVGGSLGRVNSILMGRLPRIAFQMRF